MSDRDKEGRTEGGRAKEEGGQGEEGRVEGQGRTEGGKGERGIVGGREEEMG